MNIVLVIVDSLRQDHVGAYGNEWILTPNLDSFAKDSVSFTRSYSESLPTLPVRRALLTGQRCFPFRNHKDFKGDFKGAPGWRPIPEEQETIPELLKKQGYRTCLITDTYHLFKPSKNFHRGFDEWVWIRGQEHDPYRSGPTVSRDLIEKHLPEKIAEGNNIAEFLDKYFTNNIQRRTEEDYFPARVFKESTRWIWDNLDASEFFLLIDSFDPHEPWDPPNYYRNLYDDSTNVANVIHSLYGHWEGQLTTRELKRLQANYAGEVTMVDRWFGYFIETLRYTELLDNTIVIVISDHGHNLGYDPGDKGLVSKQGHPLTHAVADLVLMIRHPMGEGAGTTCDGLFYNIDLSKTIMSFLNLSTTEMEGINFWPQVISGEYRGRDHVTIAWGPMITVITDEWWYNATIWGKYHLLYDLTEDVNLEHNLASENPSVCETLRGLAISDAGGTIPNFFKEFRDRPGCTPYTARSGEGEEN